MRYREKLELECLLELFTLTDTKVYNAEYDSGKRALVTFAYGINLDLTDPDARAFYDSLQEMKRGGKMR